MKFSRKDSVGSEHESLSAFHRVTSRYFLAVYASEKRKRPGKTDEFYREAAEYQLRQLFYNSLIPVAIFIGGIFGAANTTALPGLSHEQTVVVGIVLIVIVFLVIGKVVRKLIQHDAYASSNAERFDSLRDHRFANLFYWWSFAIAAAIPIVILVLIANFE